MEQLLTSTPDQPFVAHEPFTWDTVDQDFVYTTASRTITQEDVQSFCRTADLRGQLFRDPAHAAAAGFPAPLVPGALVFSIADGLVLNTNTWHGSGIALLEVDFRLRAPSYVGDTLHVVVRTIDARPTSREDRGVVTSRASVRNQRGQEVMEFDAVRLIRSAASYEAYKKSRKAEAAP